MPNPAYTPHSHTGANPAMSNAQWAANFESRTLKFLEEQRNTTTPFFYEPGLNFPRYIELPTHVDPILSSDNTVAGYFPQNQLRIKLPNQGIVRNLRLRLKIDFTANEWASTFFASDLGANSYHGGAAAIATDFTPAAGLDKGFGRRPLSVLTTSSAKYVGALGSNPTGMQGLIGLDATSSTRFVPFWFQKIELRSRDLVLETLTPTAILDHYRSKLPNSQNGLQQMAAATLGHVGLEVENVDGSGTTVGIPANKDANGATMIGGSVLTATAVDKVDKDTIALVYEPLHVCTFPLVDGHFVMPEFELPFSTFAALGQCPDTRWAGPLEIVIQMQPYGTVLQDHINLRTGAASVFAVDGSITTPNTTVGAQMRLRNIDLLSTILLPDPEQTNQLAAMNLAEPEGIPMLKWDTSEEARFGPVAVPTRPLLSNGPNFEQNSGGKYVRIPLLGTNPAFKARIYCRYARIEDQDYTREPKALTPVSSYPSYQVRGSLSTMPLGYVADFVPVNQQPSKNWDFLPPFIVRAQFETGGQILWDSNIAESTWRNEKSPFHLQITGFPSVLERVPGVPDSMHMLVVNFNMTPDALNQTGLWSLGNLGAKYLNLWLETPLALSDPSQYNTSLSTIPFDSLASLNHGANVGANPKVNDGTLGLSVMSSFAIGQTRGNLASVDGQMITFPSQLWQAPVVNGSVVGATTDIYIHVEYDYYWIGSFRGDNGTASKRVQS